MKNKANLVQGEIIWLHEESCKIRYKGIEEKEHRPYLFIGVNFFNEKEYLLFLPLMSAYFKNGSLRTKKDIWHEFRMRNLNKLSYVLTDFPIIISSNNFIRYQNTKVDINKYRLSQKQTIFYISKSKYKKIIINRKDLFKIIETFKILYTVN